MKQHSVPKFLDNFLTRTLSGTVFSWREILQLTFPNVLDCLSIMFISMLITALISSNGEASVAAVSLVTPLTWMITCIFNGISAGGTVVVAQSCGMKDPVRIRKAAGMTLWLTVAVGTVVCLPLLMFPRQVLTRFTRRQKPSFWKKPGFIFPAELGRFWCLPYIPQTSAFSVGWENPAGALP